MSKPLKGGENTLKKPDINKAPLAISTEAIGYYSAGLFALSTAIINETGLNGVLLVVGILLAIYGLLLLLDPFLKVLDRIPDIVRMFVIIILLSISGAQLALYLVSGILFTVLSLLFFALFVFVITYTSRSIFQNKNQLLTLFIAFTVLGVVQFVFVDRSLRWDRWDLYFILLLDIITIALFLKKALKREITESRLKP